MNYSWCFEQGAIGAIGAIPGTLLAHPFDLIKVNQQVNGGIFQAAVQAIYKGDGASSFINFTRGISPAIQQKILSKKPLTLMFSLELLFCSLNTFLLFSFRSLVEPVLACSLR